MRLGVLDDALSHIGQAGTGHLGTVPGDGVVGKTIDVGHVVPVELLLLGDQAVDQGQRGQSNPALRLLLHLHRRLVSQWR